MSQQNTPGFGIEYEILVPACFALILNNDDNVGNFLIRSNVDKNFGNMDDVVIVITMKNGQRHNFAFQLKHKESSSKNLLPGNFEASGNFSIEKYCKAFKNLKEEYKKYNFILYTNANFDVARTKEVTNFDMLQNYVCPGNEFFNTSGGRDNVYKFVVNQKTRDGKTVNREDYEDFFPQFSLYSNQRNFKKLKENIFDMLQFQEVYLKYVELFRKWHQGEFTNKTIDKETLNLHLVDIFLSSLTVEGYHLSDGKNQNLELFETAVREFDVTVIEDSLANLQKGMVKYNISEYLNLSHSNFKNQTENFVRRFKMDTNQKLDDSIEIMEQCFHRLAKEYKFSERSTTVLDEETKLKILFYLFEKPLLLDFNETSQNLIYKAMDLYRETTENKIRFVVLGLGVNVMRLSQFQIFQNLEDLSKINSDLYRNVLENSIISLQGRDNISLKQLIEFYEEIVEFTTAKELFLMLKNNHLIGEEREDLSPYYIPRSVSVTVVDVKTALYHCRETNDLLMVDFGGTSEVHPKMIEEYSINISSIKNISKENLIPQDVDVVEVDGECPKEYFLQICRQNPHRNVHYFKFLSDDSLMLITSSKNTFREKSYTFQNISVHEEIIHSECKAPVNILCAQPGMGKSTLFKSFKNRCPASIWPLYVDLKIHNSYLQEKRDSLELLDCFMELEDKSDSFLKKLKQVFSEKRKIMFLLDGLDEIENICVGNILHHVEKLSSMGYRFWLSSRQNLQQTIEDYFNLFSTEITEMSEEQQKLYVRKRLRFKYEEHEIEEIIAKIFVNIANNRQILGIPLQLKIITEIFLDDRRYNQKLNENIFVLSKMYKQFFEGRYRHSVEKLKSENPHLTIGDLEDQLEKYEIAALSTLFNDDVIKKLNLDLRRNRRFLEKIKTRKDLLGIIVKINAESQAVFEHTTFAEYFASVFLLNNFDKTKILQPYLFSEKYENLFLIFSILLAEDNNLHLAVIYKDIDQIRKHIEDESNLDQGGRNVLHLSTIHSVRFPVLTHSQRDNLIYIEDLPLNSFGYATDISKEAQEIVEYLIETLKFDPLEKDEVFLLNALEYSLEFGSLYVVEKILQRYPHSSIVNDILWKYFDDVNVAYYSIKFGYLKLLELVLSKQDFIISNISSWLSNSMLRLVESSKYDNKIEIIKLLVEDYETKQKKEKRVQPFMDYLRIFLSSASTKGDTILLKYLLEKGVDVNFQNSDWEHGTALFCAVDNSQIDAASLLLDAGADVNFKDKLYQTTPLHSAAIIGNIEMIDLLLSRGADLEAEDLYGTSPLSNAVRNGNIDVVNFLVEKGASYDATTLHDAIDERNIKMIEMFLGRGIDIDAEDEDGATPLFKAVQEHFTDVVKFLLERGAKCEAKILHSVAEVGNIETMEVFLDAGFDVNVKDERGETPLFYAVRSENTDMVNFLLNKEADVSVVSKRDGTIVHLLIGRPCFTQTLDDLLNQIDVDMLYVTDDDGASPLHLSVYKDGEALQLLLKKELDLDRFDVHNEKYPLHSAVKEGHLDADLLKELYSNHCQ